MRVPNSLDRTSNVGDVLGNMADAGPAAPVASLEGTGVYGVRKFACI